MRETTGAKDQGVSYTLVLKLVVFKKKEDLGMGIDGLKPLGMTIPVPDF